MPRGRLPHATTASAKRLQQQQNRTLRLAFQRQPYEVSILGLNLVVAKDVFPPDVASTTGDLARSFRRYRPTSALDVGCGCGILALALRLQGVQDVWATDSHAAAVECTRTNLRRHPHLRPIRILCGDLFRPIPPKKRFELIVFNQPYYPWLGDPLFGLALDSGRKVIERFLTHAETYLIPGGIILMPFSDFAGPENDPKRLSRSHSFRYRTIAIRGLRRNRHYVYELRPRE